MKSIKISTRDLLLHIFKIHRVNNKNPMATKIKLITFELTRLNILINGKS